MVKTGYVIATVIAAGAVVGIGYYLLQQPKPKPAAVSLGFTVGGQTTYPGIVDLNISLKNEGSTTETFAILAVIGNPSPPGLWAPWYGPNYPLGSPYADLYRDGLPVCQVPNPYDQWWAQAFICTGPLGPGQSYNVTRKIEIPDLPFVTDAVVEVWLKQDVSFEAKLARQHKTNVVQGGSGPLEATLTALAVSGSTSYPGIATITATIKNTGNIAHKFALLYVLGNANISKWYGPDYYRDGLPECEVGNPFDPWFARAFTCIDLNPDQEGTLTRQIEIPNDSQATDLMVEIHRSDDSRVLLAQRGLLNVITPGSGMVAAQITNLTVA